MNKEFSILEKKIKEYKKILIYRHKSPDGDALGSQFALRDFIKLNFKNKVVKAVESDNDYVDQNFLKKLFPDNLSHEAKITNSLIIILDTSTKDRVSGIFEGENNFIFKIDHHPILDKFYDFQIQSTQYSSTCELIADFMLNYKKFKINKKIAEYLFIGMVTDTGRFLFPSTSSRTLLIASKLLSYKVETKKIFTFLNSINLKTWKYQSNIVNKALFLKDKAIFVDEQESFKDFDLTFEEVSSLVNTLMVPIDIKYALYAIWDSKNKYFKISLRSKEKPINKLAEKFNGGGHSLASGAKAYSKKELLNLISEFKKWN